MNDYIALNINDNQGYSPDQVSRDSITLDDLLAAVEDAIESRGGDTKVVLFNGQRYGAAWGNISQWGDVFAERSPACDEDEDDE